MGISNIVGDLITFKLLKQLIELSRYSYDFRKYKFVRYLYLAGFIFVLSTLVSIVPVVGDWMVDSHGGGLDFTPYIHKKYMSSLLHIFRDFHLILEVILHYVLYLVSIYIIEAGNKENEDSSEVTEANVNNNINNEETVISTN